MKTIDGLICMFHPGGLWAELSGSVKVDRHNAVRLHIGLRQGAEVQDLDAVIQYLHFHRERLKVAVAQAADNDAKVALDMIFRDDKPKQRKA